MANQQNSYTGSQGTGTNSADFSFTFPSFTTSEVRVEVDNVVKTLTTHYTVENYNTTSGGTVRFTTNNIPTGTTPVRIFRQTDVDSPKATFSAGSSLKAGEINDNFKQLRHALQEAIGANTTDRQVQEFNIEDGAITSAKIKDSTIVEADLANSAITQNKLANNSVGTPELINGSVNSDKILDGTIVNADVNASAAIAGTKISPVFGSQTIITTGNAAVGGTLAVTSDITVAGTVDGRDVAADGTKLDTIETNAKDDQTASEIKTLLQSDKLTASEIAEGALDGRYFTETESDARYFNVSTGDTIKDGDTFPDNDTTIATTAAINDRIIDLVDDVGGFVPIANETSFPTANPDVNNGAGTLVSIKEISSTRTPSTGTVTIANGSGSNTVTITGCGSTVLTAGFGVIVETTTTLHTYAFHRLVPKATEVTTVASISSNITTVANNTSNINAVAADASDIGIVAADGTDIGLVAGSISNVNTTAGSIANVNTVAGSISNVNAVGTNISNVNSVASNESNINSAVSNASNINSAVSNASNINTVAGSISNVNTTAGSISNVNTVASNISSVNSFANTYRIGSTNPTTSLDVGDLFFNTTSDSLKVYTGSAWVDGVTQTGNFALKTGNTFTGSNIYNDNVKALFGTGSDFEIFHTGSHTFLENSTGHLCVRAGGGQLQLQATNGEHGVLVNPDGAVDLYYDNTKRFHTRSNGVEVTGSAFIRAEDASDSILLMYADDGDDHDDLWRLRATDSGSNFHLDNYASSSWETNIKAIGNGAVELYYDNSKKFETTSTGALLGDHTVANVNTLTKGVLDLGAQYSNTDGTPKLYVYNDTNAYLGFGVSSNQLDVCLSSTGYDFVTYAGTTELFRVEGTGNVQIPADSKKLQIGAGQDLELYHDGSNSYIDNHVGDLYIRGNGDDIFLKAVDTKDSLRCIPNGAVKLFYNDSVTFETVTNGIIAKGAEGADAHVYIFADEADDVADQYWLRTAADGTGIYLQNYVSGSAETNLRAVGNGTTELYYDNSKKFETTSGGAFLTGTLTVGANTSNGLDIFNFGNTNFIRPQGGTLDILTPSNSNLARFIPGGAVELYHNGSKKFETNSDGAMVSSATNDAIFRIKSTNQDGAPVLLFIADNGDNNEDFWRLRADGGATAFAIQNYAGGAWESNVICRENGNVELRYDNSKKLETASDGVHITGALHIDTTQAAVSGIKQIIYEGATLYQNAATGTGSSNGFYLGNSTGAVAYVWNYENSDIQFATNNTTRWRILSGGDLIPHTDSAYDIGTNGTRVANIYADTLYGDGSNLTGISTDLVGDTSPQLGGDLDTNSHHILLDDSHEVKFGDGQDFKLQHNGTDSYIINSTGILYRRSANHYFMNADGSEYMFIAQNNGSFKAYYDGSNIFATTSTGLSIEASKDIRLVNGNWTGNSAAKLQHHSNFLYIQGGSNGIRFRDNGSNDRWIIDSSGNLTPGVNNTYDIGHPSYRVANIYTNDLHLSNEGSSNDVDGTWGDWTIQEGASDLFLKNNRSGKKYKFNLMEVS